MKRKDATWSRYKELAGMISPSESKYNVLKERLRPELKGLIIAGVDWIYFLAHRCSFIRTPLSFISHENVTYLCPHLVNLHSLTRPFHICPSRRQPPTTVIVKNLCRLLYDFTLILLMTELERVELKGLRSWVDEKRIFLIQNKEKKNCQYFLGFGEGEV